MSAKEIEELRLRNEIQFGQMLELNEKMDKTLSYLHNDDKTGRKGLIQTVDGMQEQIVLIKKDIDTINKREEIKDAYKKGQIVALGFIGAGAWTLVKMLIPLLAKLF